jgi:hypothetical protein
VEADPRLAEELLLAQPQVGKLANFPAERQRLRRAFP